MSERPDRRSTAYIDLEAMRPLLESSGKSPAQLIAHVVSLARSHGRMIAATAYGDLDPTTARELRRYGCDARPTSEDGEGSAPESIAIACDLAEAVAAGPEVDAVILVTDDAQLGEVVRRVRRAGRFVVAVVPSALIGHEPALTADRQVPAEALLSGELEGEPAEPLRLGAPRRAAPAPLDLDNYDWSRLVLLMRDLEAKMPFVGMRWLKNKVLGPHNVGVASVGEKQGLLNRAVDEGLIETYRVGNREEGGEPVTACRLRRDSERVREIVDANPAPPTPLAAGGEGE